MSYGRAVERFLGLRPEYLGRLQASCRNRDQQPHSLVLAVCRRVYSLFGMSGLVCDLKVVLKDQC